MKISSKSLILLALMLTTTSVHAEGNLANAINQVGVIGAVSISALVIFTGLAGLWYAASGIAGMLTKNDQQRSKVSYLAQTAGGLLLMTLLALSKSAVDDLQLDGQGSNMNQHILNQTN